MACPRRGRLDIMAVMKRCPKCEESKPLDAFHKDRRRRDGLFSRCKTCSSREERAKWADPAKRAKASEAYREWHQRNAESNTARTAKWAASEKGAQYRAERKAAGQPVAGTVAYHAERLVVLERDDGACGICDDDVDPFDYSLDHIVPIKRGGLHELDNLQLAHRSCNSKKAMTVA